MNQNPYYITHKWYSLTLNPIDKYQFCGRQDRIKKFSNFIFENTLAFPGKLTYVIEISEPRGMHVQGKMGPRLHVHGWFQFTSRKQIGHFLTHTFYALLRWTSVDIDTIDNLATWKAYCKKQRLIKPHRYTSLDEDEDDTQDPDTFINPYDKI